MKSKNKHDHRLTNFLKVFIFMIIMLAPFIAIGVKCGYVMLNNNANQSYRGAYSFESKLDETYKVNYNSGISRYLTQFTYNSINIDKIVMTDQLSGNYFNADANKFIFFNDYSIKIDDTHYNTSNYFVIWYYKPQNKIYLRTFVEDIDLNDENNINILNGNNQNNIFTLINKTLSQEIDITNFNNIVFSTDSRYFKQSSNSTGYYVTGTYFNTIQYSYVSDTTLSSVFYSAVQELDKASIFSWTTKTAIYSGLLAMSEGLGVDTPPLAVLLTYWTIITSIYIIIDIILEMFIFLTHWLNDKIC